jgi:hypothetical protein
LACAGVLAHRSAPQALFTTALTLPVVLVLNAMFSHLRSPHERAIAGEFTSESENADYDCFIFNKVCNPPGHFRSNGALSRG